MNKDQIIFTLDQLPPEQLAEVNDFIDFLRFKAGLTRTKHATLPTALGLLTTGQSAPSDETVQRWLDERRLEKYG